MMVTDLASQIFLAALSHSNSTGARSSLLVTVVSQTRQALGGTAGEIRKNARS
jgi:hypothetical protein